MSQDDNKADNVDRMNMFIEQLVKQGTYKRILIVDDEADITSIGYEKRRQQEEKKRIQEMDKEHFDEFLDNMDKEFNEMGNKY